MEAEPKTSIDVSRESQRQGELGLACLARGDLLGAEAALRTAHANDPGHAPWLFHLVRILLRMDRDFEAMECLRQGTDLMPDATCLIRLAYLEHLYGDPDRALEAALRGLQLDPRDLMGHIVAAKSLSESGKEDESQEHWQTADRLAASNEHTVQLERARHHREQGQFNQAIAEAKKIVTKRPDCAGALALLAESSRVNASDLSLLREMEVLAQRKTTPPAERISLGFAIGKLYDDLGHYQDAMVWFDRANATALASKSGQGPFNPEAYTRSIHARMEILSAELIGNAGNLGSPDETPIFVVGMIRSGTTLVEQILSRHSQVRGAGEQKFWLSAEPTFLDLRTRRLDKNSLQGAASTYTRLLNRYLGDAMRVVDKQPGNLLLAGALHIAFPKAHIIYMHRDPLDNAVSIWNTNIQTSLPFMHDKSNLAFAMRQHQMLMHHWQQVLPADRFMVLSYESLVEDQERWTRELVRFCGLPWEEACLNPEKSTARISTPSLLQVRQPVYRTSVGRWKNYEPWLGELKRLQDSVG